jgi:hypothetical protein
MKALFNIVPKKNDESNVVEELDADTGPTFTDITQEIEYQRANVVCKTKITDEVFTCVPYATSILVWHRHAPQSTCPGPWHCASVPLPPPTTIISTGTKACSGDEMSECCATIDHFGLA